MAAPMVVIDDAEEDVDMANEPSQGENDGEVKSEPDAERPKFIDYLRSPIIELVIGEGDDQETLHAHESLLAQSPLLADLIATADPPRRITLNEDLPAVASALEYLYRRDYFPTLTSSSALEADASVPSPDEAGAALLRHARIYTLARKLGLPALSALAHRKIHLVESTARGEIAYARYVYAHTADDDREIRRPVAQFWATRSHVLRHEAEQDFRDTCLRFPQLGFDVLTMVLDAQEKRSGRLEGGSTSGGPGRKRARTSQG